MSSRRFLEPTQRPLTAPEVRTLRSRGAALVRRGRRATASAIPIGAGFIGVLWALTMLASEAPWTVVTGFWLLVGAGITWWARRDLKKDQWQSDAVADRIASALRRNIADVYEIRATAYVDIEEEEDEGACYAFQVAPQTLLFITGQEFYASARFPSLDFALIYPLDEHGQSVDMLIQKRGHRTAPVRRVPATVKTTLDIPEHLELRTGTLDGIEACLRSSTGPGER